MRKIKTVGLGVEILEVSRANGAHNRDSILTIERSHELLDYNCQVCGKNDTPLLIGEDSNSEYSGTVICKNCIDKAFDLFLGLGL